MKKATAKRPARFVLATPICDGHDAAISAITRILRSEGVEAVYIGFNKTPYQIVKAAVEEDATGIALSSYNGGHMSFFREVLKEQKAQGIPQVPLFCGGGGTILAREVAPLEKMGVAKVYRPPMDLLDAIRDMVRRAEKSDRRDGRPSAESNGFTAMARTLSHAEWSGRNGHAGPRGAKAAPVWGIGGRGGAGKSTIVDELVYRFLHATRKGRIAVLSVDPTLGDRLRMLHCYSPRVYMRSVRLGAGESPDKLAPMVDRLRHGGFDLVIVESVGLGQIDLGVAPFVDHSIFCMTPEYGTNVQLDKEALLHRADIVVMNKADYPQAAAKARRVQSYLKDRQTFIRTEAKRHRDAGVTQLFLEIAERSGLELKADTGLEAAPPEAAVPNSRRNYLGGIVDAHEAYYAEMNRTIREALGDASRAKPYRKEYRALWEAYGFDPASIERVGRGKGEGIEKGVLYRTGPDGKKTPVARKTTCEIWVPVLGLPSPDADTREIITYLYKQNVPGQFPFTEGAFTYRRQDEDPIRMFAGLGLAEDTNARFHLLRQRGGAPRLSTAFDSLTLYGLDSDAPGAMAKVGEGGVAVDTVDDMMRLYDGFNLEEVSVSLTMSGPAPAILAMFFLAAKKRGFSLKKLRGTIQTDILKEIHAQNESILPLDPSLRLIGDMFEFTMREAPQWYPISISGYHIGEKGANPIQELAFTLANGFTYVEVLKQRGLDIEEFSRRFSFFFTTGSELEFNVLGRVARRIWAVGMKRYYGVEGPGMRLKYHSQTSGRSLQDVEPLHNLARVTLQAEHALANNTNSLHTNSYKETYTTPEEDDVMLAMGCQQIPLLESGDYRFTENLHQGGYGLSYLEDEVERAVHRIFREIDQQGGVIPAIENEYFRTVIQEEVERELARERAASGRSSA
jgi:isobutyryl-CoA mutase